MHAVNGIEVGKFPTQAFPTSPLPWALYPFLPILPFMQSGWGKGVKKGSVTYLRRKGLFLLPREARESDLPSVQEAEEEERELQLHATSLRISLGKKRRGGEERAYLAFTHVKALDVILGEGAKKEVLNADPTAQKIHDIGKEKSVINSMFLCSTVKEAIAFRPRSRLLSLSPSLPPFLPPIHSRRWV